MLLTRFSAVLWHIHNNNILFKEASCEEKRPWCCRGPIKTWQNRHLSTYSSLRSLKSSVKACILLSLSSLLLRGLQTVKLIEELDLRQKRIQHFPLGRAADRVCPECAPGQLWAPHCPHEIPRRPGPRSELSGSAQNTRLVNCVLLTALTGCRPPPKSAILRRIISEELLSDWALLGYARRPAPRRE